MKGTIQGAIKNHPKYGKADKMKATSLIIFICLPLLVEYQRFSRCSFDISIRPRPTALMCFLQAILADFPILLDNSMIKSNFLLSTDLSAVVV